jgi:hypothetical protein
MSGAIPLLPLCAFITWTGTTIPNINNALYAHKENYFSRKMYNLAVFTIRFFSKLFFLIKVREIKAAFLCAVSHLTLSY